MTASSAAYLEIILVEYSGAGSFIDCNNGGGTAGTVTTSAITTPSNNALLVGLVWAQGSGGLSFGSVSGGYTTRQSNSIGVIYDGAFDSLTNTAGAQTFSASLTPTSGTYIGAVIMGFNGSAGGATRHRAYVVQH